MKQWNLANSTTYITKKPTSLERQPFFQIMHMCRLWLGFQLITLLFPLLPWCCKSAEQGSTQVVWASLMQLVWWNRYVKQRLFTFHGGCMTLPTHAAKCHGCTQISGWYLNFCYVIYPTSCARPSMPFTISGNFVEFSSSDSISFLSCGFSVNTVPFCGGILSCLCCTLLACTWRYAFVGEKVWLISIMRRHKNIGKMLKVSSVFFTNFVLWLG